MSRGPSCAWVTSRGQLWRRSCTRPASGLYTVSREHQEELAALRLRLKQQEDDRCQTLQAQVDHVHSQLALAGQERHQLETANQRLQGKTHQLELDARTLRSEVECLTKEVELKQREVQGAVARVRTELQAELDGIEAAKALHQQTEKTLKETRSQLARREEELEKETRRHRDDVRRLRDELKRRETEIMRNKEDELQRAAILHGAFRNYFSASPQRSGRLRRGSSAADPAAAAAAESEDDH
ncbi:reticulocyte-binding protein 2 homolog a-like [Pollicipes pollicipes]|uniref:reticulocyte-binding protein 2 homolog a-like n=1 Tax=Pollicipes pollicipes TaxID=41117 RepID=UPI001884EFF8|nr:reticulocyte-binding protein 2 homolog a-like [Pollicipes pollicipes]